MAPMLQDNPFHTLGATSRDNRRQIVELADQKLFELDQSLCQKARSDLTHPKSRLAAEIAWLPGVSPSRAKDLVSKALDDPRSVWLERALPKLAHANAMATACEGLYPEDHNHLPDQLLQLCAVEEAISAEEVLRDINEDRAVAGFPEVQDIQLVEEQLQERKRHYRNAIKAVLNRLPPQALVDTVTKVVEYATRGGQFHAPELVVELVEMYQVEAQDFLQKEAANIQTLAGAVRSAASEGRAAVGPLIDKLAAVTRNWDRIAQPIQLSFMATGQRHPESNEVAFGVRGLAVDLCNEHGLLEEARQLTDLLTEVFAEVPEVVEKAEEDKEALEGIFHDRKHAESQRADWGRSITYQVEIGTFFKKTLSISPTGISWDGWHYPLESVTRLRWGGIRHSQYGVHTDTTYTIAFGDDRSEAVVETRSYVIYSAFTERLFKAVGVRLLTEMLEKLRVGPVTIGEAVIRDTSVSLPRKKLFSNETLALPWNAVTVGSADGSLIIRSRADNKVYAQLSYIYTPNVHLVEQAIRMAFDRGLSRLSDILRGP